MTQNQQGMEVGVGKDWIWAKVQAGLHPLCLWAEVQISCLPKHSPRFCSVWFGCSDTFASFAGGIGYHPWHSDINLKLCKHIPGMLTSLLGNTGALRAVPDATQKWNEHAGGVQHHLEVVQKVLFGQSLGSWFGSDSVWVVSVMSHKTNWTFPVCFDPYMKMMRTCGHV